MYCCLTYWNVIYDLLQVFFLCIPMLKSITITWETRFTALPLSCETGCLQPFQGGCDRGAPNAVRSTSYWRPVSLAEDWKIGHNTWVIRGLNFSTSEYPTSTCHLYLQGRYLDEPLAQVLGPSCHLTNEPVVFAKCFLGYFPKPWSLLKKWWLSRVDWGDWEGKGE